MKIYKQLRNSQTIKIRLAAIGILIFLFVIGGVKSCVTKKRIREDKNDQKQIERTRGKLEITNQEKHNANIQIKKSDHAANEAAFNFNQSLRRNSAIYNSNFRSAKAEYCAEYPGDKSKCGK